MLGVFEVTVARPLLSKPITSSGNVTLQVLLIVTSHGVEIRVSALHDAVVPVIETLNGGVVQGLVLTLFRNVSVRPLKIFSFTA